jgi:hypothetical protein
MTKANENQVSNDTGQETGDSRVISFDGGPSPMVTLRILQKIEHWYTQKYGGKSFIKQANMFAGTSDGGLMSLFMANALRKDPELSGMKLLEKCIEFNDKLVHMFKLDDAARRRLIWGKESVFERKTLKDILDAEFEETRMQDLEGQSVLVGAFDATTWQMTTYSSRNVPSDGDMKLVDVGLATSAFPILLPPFTSPTDPQRKDHLIVDGVFASNSMITAAITEANLRYVSKPQGEGAEGNDPRDRLKLLSIGSTSKRFPNQGSEEISSFKIILFLLPLLNRLVKIDSEIINQPMFRPTGSGTGWRSWFENLFSLLNGMVDGGSELDDRMAIRTLGNKRYFRLQPEVPNFHLALLAFADPQQAIKAAADFAEKFFEEQEDSYEQNKRSKPETDATPYEHSMLLRWIEENWK